MSRFIDAVGNIIDTTGQNQPAVNAAIQPAADPQAGQSAKVLAPTYISVGGTNVGCISSPA